MLDSLSACLFVHVTYAQVGPAQVSVNMLLHAKQHPQLHQHAQLDVSSQMQPAHIAC